MTTQPIDEETGETQVRPFAAVLQELAKGRVHDRASGLLHALVADVECKPPKSPPASAYFVDDTGNLSRRDPRQMELPLRDAAADPTRSATS